MNTRTEEEWTKLLTKEQYNVLRLKSTELAGTGIYNECNSSGQYCCAGCGNALFNSSAKFDSGCGWPSFDDSLPGAVSRTLDADGKRTEITCAKCLGHLGHVFLGEGFTSADTRHCVNSVALKLVAAVTTTSVIGEKFLGHDGVLVNLPAADITCIYVSAFWCPPCKVFTPILSRVYSEWHAAGKSVNIIFASRDSDEKSFKSYFDKMSFPYAFPFGDTRVDELMSKWKIRGIPSLVVLDRCGTVIKLDGRSDIQKLGVSAYDAFCK
jgi:peptide-methionine (R)-S-oxide reductase